MHYEQLVDPATVAYVRGIGDISGPKRKAPVTYRSRKNGGKAKVLGGYEGETGAWVVLHDRERNATVTVRPSQVSAL